MNALLFVPLQVDSPGRVRRFNVGDRVSVVRGGLEILDTVVLTWAADSMDALAFSHCAGKSAKYRIDGYDGWVYDWMLELPVSRRHPLFHHS